MLEKLATHQVETVTTLFALAEKYARAAEGRAWHFAPHGGPAQTSGPSVAAPGGGKKKNKKNHGLDKPRAGAPVAAAAAAGGHSSRHSATECREIKKLAEHLSKRRDQASREGSSPPRRSGKEKVSEADAAATERELGYLTPNKDLMVSSTSPTLSPWGDECRKKLYVMYGSNLELISQ
jgi:hypothetical protein